MQVSEISLGRKRNLGNYEFIESSVTVAMVEGDNPEEALGLAKDFLSKALGLENPKTTAIKAQVKTTTNAKKEEKEEEVAIPPVIEEEVEKKVTKKKVSKKVTKKKEVEISKEEVLNALREYAKAKKSKEQAQAVLESTTGAASLAEVDKKDYAKLIKALAV